jgi:hypothetical protein
MIFFYKEGCRLGRAKKKGGGEEKGKKLLQKTLLNFSQH